MQNNSSDHTTWPAPVADYFEHETTDSEAVARCFSEDAVVFDEHHEHRGRAAIAAWNHASKAKYNFKTEVLQARSLGEVVAVTTKVSGNFPGSPVELQFRFTLSAGLIQRLEITP